MSLSVQTSMGDTEVHNHSMVKELILLGFPVAPCLQILFFATFLVAYPLVLAENTVIIMTVWANCNLHWPMYFFLSNLSFLEIWYVTVTLPKTMLSFVTVTKKISFMGYMTQCTSFSAWATQCVSSWLSWHMTATLPFASLSITLLSWDTLSVSTWLQDLGWLVS